MYMCAYTRIHVYTQYIHPCTHACTHACMHIRTHASMCTCIHTHTHTHTHTPTYIQDTQYDTYVSLDTSIYKNGSQAKATLSICRAYVIKDTFNCDFFKWPSQGHK